MKNKVISARANAKVNLALHVIGQRKDGLHLLDSVVAFPDYGDELSFEKDEKFSLSISGPFGHQLQQRSINDTNIILKAAKLFKHWDSGVKIKLIKNLPVSSGIGGGSSDAAVTLQILSKLWKKNIPDFKEILKLGADVPVCLSNSLQRMQGIGEILTPLVPPHPMWIVLANPGIEVPTKKIFGLLAVKENGKLEPFHNLKDQESFYEYLRRQRNDLEGVTSELFPEIRIMLQTFNSTTNCKLCRMSGSGATCFGLYNQKDHAIDAQRSITETFSKAWVVMAPLFLTNPRHHIIS